MIVLIDDDKYIRYGWDKRARKAEIEFLSFESIEDFIVLHAKVPFESFIYIDSNLQNGLKGEIEAKKLFEIGFSNLFLATGDYEISIEDFPWIRGVISKTPPF